MRKMKKLNLKLFYIVLAVFSLVTLFGSVEIVSADPGYFGGCGMMNGGYPGFWGYGTGMMYFGFITWLLVIAALILFIVWIIKQTSKK